MPAGHDIPTGHGVIEGTVVDAVTHEPLQKSKVTMACLGKLRRRHSPMPAGASSFRELPAGGYWLNASKSGYNQAQDSLGADPNLQITLGADETKKGIEIALVPGGSISGRVAE